MQPNTSFVAEENPYTVGYGLVDDNQKALRRVDDGARRLSNDESLEDIDELSLNTTIEQQDQQQTEVMEEERAATNVAFTESLIGTPREELIPQSIAAARDDYQASLERAQQAATPFFARVYNTPGAEHLTDQEIATIAIKDYAKDSFASALDEQGGWETAGDILNMMIIPDESYNAAKLSEGNWFTSLSGMEELARRRQALLPHEQIEFDNTIKNMIQDVESSQVQQYLTLLSVMGENQQLAVDHWLDKSVILDVAALGTGIVKGLRSLNKMRQLSGIGDAYGAARAADLASADKAIARGVGVPQVDAAMSGNPLKELLKDTTLNGTTTSPSSDTRTLTQDIDKALDKVDSVIGVKPLATDREAAEVASRWTKNMEANDTIEGVEITQLMDGVDINYTTPEGGNNMFVQYTLDDFGGFNTKEIPLSKAFTRHLWSPMFMQKGDKDLLVNAPIIGEFKRSRMLDGYIKAAEAAIKPIRNKRESVEKINHVLNKMNGLDIPNDRHHMVDVGIGGTKLTNQEYDSFYGIRRIFDHMHRMNNETMRSEMKLRGLKSVSIGNENYYAKKYDSAEDAIRAYNLDIDNNQVMAADGSVIDRVTKEMIDAQYAQGNVLTKVDGSDQYGWFRNAENNHSRYAFVEKGGVKGVPEQVLPYTPNYVPRSRHEANYFIRKKVPMTVNGNKKLRERTVAYAHTEAQANKYLEKLSKADKDFDPDAWVVSFDREMPDAGKTDMNAVRMNGGLYRGSRSSTGIAFAGDATEGQVVDALDTLQRAMQYTADRASMSEMRTVMRHRWYQDAGNIDESIIKLNWNEARGAIADSNASPQIKAKLLSAHDQISNVSNVPTKSEQAFQGAMRAIGKHWDKKGQEKIARYFYNKSKDGNPVNALKGGAFHMMLGAFNPAQYVVQMMGAASAIGANPVQFTKAFPRIMAAHLTDLIDNKNGRDAAIRWLEKKGILTDNVRNDIEYWRASGMHESVLRNNADFDNSGKFMPLSAGAVRRGFGSLANKSTVFYEMGELSNMRTSFFTALEHQKSLAGKSWKYSEDNLQKVVARAEQYRLGMSSANKAQFQKGIMALPTQFKSIYTKFLEAIMGDNFTASEKSRIVLSQMALFGTTGVPFLNYWSDAIIEMLAPEDASAEQLKLYKEGSVGWLVSEYWDIDAAISGRVAIAGDIVKEIEDMMFSEEPFLKSFMGASFTSTEKGIDAFKNILMAGKMVWDDEDLGSYDKVGTTMAIAAQQLAQIPTSTRRWMEAYVLDAFGEVRTSSGRTLYKIAEEDVQMRDVMARALGFSSSEMQDIYETNQALYKRKDKVRDIADFYVSMLNNLTIAVDAGDEKNTEAVQMVLSAVNNRFQNDQDRQDIIRAIQAGLQDRNFKDRTIQQWLETHMSGLLNAKGSLFVTGEKEFEKRTK